MILVTGGTGFVGQALIRQLVSMGKSVRILLRPSPKSPNIPLGIPVEVAVCSLRDERGLRAAMKGVDVVYHLAGTERFGTRADLNGVDVEGTQVVAQVANQAGVERLFFLSHLGADRASAFPVLKAKALAEGFVAHSGVDFTVFRSAAIFGPEDQFTVSLARLLAISPFFFLMPGDGSIQLQPIWVEDVVTCLTLALEDRETRCRTIEIGGSEYFPFREIIDIIQRTTGIKRRIISIAPGYLRPLAVYLEQTSQGLPISLFWLDTLAADRTCPLDSLPRLFGLMPARFTQHIDYLKNLPRKPVRRRR